MIVDYNKLVKEYDLSRTANINTVIRLANDAKIVPTSVVVDFGSGTGNYSHALSRLTNAKVIGVEPSDGMRETAVSKGSDVSFLKGDHTYIPLEDNSVDFIYLIDVIHHVADINQMFRQFYRILKTDGDICIVTESHEQLGSRFWNKYFESLLEIERNRYPDLHLIIEAADENGFSHIRTDSTDIVNRHTISDSFMQLVKNKGYSMFRLLSDNEFRYGFDMLKQDYCNKAVLKYTHGESFVWFMKK